MADLDLLRTRWEVVVAGWADAMARAAALPPEALDEQVDGEWSFAQTLRHLIFATDAWLRRPVLRLPEPFWSAALPHTECPDAEVEPFGIDRAATPGWDAIVATRAERQDLVGRYLASITAAELDEHLAPGAPPPDLGADSDVLTAERCLRVIVSEEESHLGYATRDLAVLEPRVSGDAPG